MGQRFNPALVFVSPACTRPSGVPRWQPPRRAPGVTAAGLLCGWGRCKPA